MNETESRRRWPIAWAIADLRTACEAALYEADRDLRVPANNQAQVAEACARQIRDAAQRAYDQIKEVIG